MFKTEAPVLDQCLFNSSAWICTMSTTNQRSSLGKRLSKLPKLIYRLGLLIRDLFRYPRLRTDLMSSDRWKFDQLYKKLRLNCYSQEKLEKIKQSLQQYNFSHSPTITITFSSRHLGNRDNLIENFFHTILAQTYNLMDIEILIWVDDDDDLIYYHQLKTEYQDLIPLRFVVGDRGNGYGDLMRFNTELYKLRRETSTLWLGVSEDAIITLKNWDVAIQSIFKESDENQCIGAQISFQKTIEKQGPFYNYPTPIYQYGAECYPVARIALIESIEKAIEYYDGWTPLGSVVGTDAFLADILRHMWERHNINMHVQLPSFIKRSGGQAWVNNQKRIEIHYQAVNKFMSEETQIRHNEIVDYLFQSVYFSDRSRL